MCSAWRIFVFVICLSLLISLFFIIELTTTITGCLIVDGTTTANCKNFTLFSHREFIEPICPLSSTIVAAMWIIFTRCCWQRDPTVRDMLRILGNKMLFFKNSLLGVCLIGYYIYVFIDDHSRPGAWYYLFLPFELIASTLLMYVLNYRRTPSVADKKKYPGIQYLHFIILAIWTLYNMCYGLIDSMNASLKLFTFPEKELYRLDIKFVNIFFFIIAGVYRYTLGHFFLEKLFCVIKGEDYIIYRDANDSQELIQDDLNANLHVDEQGVKYSSKEEKLSLVNKKKHYGDAENQNV